MFPAINAGPFVLPTAPLLYILGAWLCFSLGEWVATQLGLNVDHMTGLITAGLLAAVIGARLTFVLIHWSAYQDNLLGIIWPINSGFSTLGGIFFGSVAMIFYGRYKQMPLAATLDGLAPVFVTGLIVISLADFLGGPGFGTITRMPWGITLFSVQRHPVQLYEILVGIITLLVWWVLRPRQQFAGQLFLVATAVYCFGRLFVDAFRENAWLIDGWHIIQLLCLAIVLTCLLLLGKPQKVFQNQMRG